MTMLHGQHLIAGTRCAGPGTFRSSPATGPAHDHAIGSADLVDQACRAADAAFAVFAATSWAVRADLLEGIARRIEDRAEVITDIATAETGLPAARIEGERQRTCGQLRLFASHIRAGTHLDLRHDPALLDRKPQPRPSLTLIQRPIGPVAVFGASNFPLAFSVAGGDTASALAAGCPVVVKGHSGHPGTSEVVGDAIAEAIAAAGLPGGVFSLVQGGSRAVGEALVQHPAIKAVGFTGSTGGGRALFDLCAARPEPIPFFGELGSVNPVFVLPEAAAARAAGIGAGWAASLTLGAGQFCTNPGIVVMIAGPDATTFRDAALAALGQIGPQVMLTDGIAEAYRAGQHQMAAAPGVSTLLGPENEGRTARPAVFQTSGADFLASHDLQEEVFGPLGLIVTVADMGEMRRVAESFQGQLTATLQIDDGDIEAARTLVPMLERLAGRLLVNGFPTGVEVADAMVHGGPYPASTNFGATSVGTMAIRRFLRLVCYQNFPAALLPETFPA
ncbi:aldehyde dehydrogenase (NADP(+)) [Fuscibacter oryzae]|uniref:Aldehyde dehydrogenase (NADP(+)) n=1 Tax=Fuscibacter oryzae TaxID=2803939 RepID=A0A8J7MYU7_9RHOB|nr:aldehyde dehydrogenase (NADP(+)) [Fuscibacter oryzae]MBL4929534.1 aldehyde dehydrogenase (NADP(+)) [Fuscibacter oryzae]